LDKNKKMANKKMAKKKVAVVVKEVVDESPLVDLVLTVGIKADGLEEATKQYDAAQHDVFDLSLRKKKEVSKPTGVKDAAGKDIMTTTSEEVNRMGLPLQKLIVNRRVAFMNVGKMEIDCKVKTKQDKTLLGMVHKCREDNKLKYRTKEIAKRMMSELRCAALWYSEDVDAGYWGELAPKATKRMRMRVLSPLLGDVLLPVFNGLGDLVYFGRQYTTTKDVTSVEITADVIKTANDKIEHVDIYTDTYIFKFQKEGTGWLMTEKTPHSYGKIPIIYYHQDRPEWADVQSVINRLETLLSNFADTNDYNGSPILVAKGTIKGFSAKGERGKVLELQGENSDIKYVTWQQAPESIKLEIETDLDFIYTCTQTPNISFKEMKGLGASPSGVAFDRILMDAHLAAQNKLDDTYGECAQRELNFLKAACIAINTSLLPSKNLAMTPVFTLFRIDDQRDGIDNAVAALNGGVASLKTAVKIAGLTDDDDAETLAIQGEHDTLGNEFEETIES
jgi:SPP1 family phage portal protein